MHAALDKAGVENRLKMYAGADHDFYVKGDPARTDKGRRCCGEWGSSGVSAKRWWSRCTAAHDSGLVQTMTRKYVSSTFPNAPFSDAG